MPRHPQLPAYLSGCASLRPDREHRPAPLLRRMPRNLPLSLFLYPWLLHLRLLWLFHRYPPFQSSQGNDPSFLLRQSLHRPSPVFHRFPHHPPSNAISPSRLVTRRTVLPSVPPCKRAPSVCPGVPSPKHCPQSLAPSSFSTPPGSQKIDRQDIIPQSPGEAACGCNTGANAESSLSPLQNSQTAPVPKTPHRSSSKTARSSPGSSDDAPAI